MHSQKSTSLKSSAVKKNVIYQIRSLANVLLSSLIIAFLSVTLLPQDSLLDLIVFENTESEDKHYKSIGHQNKEIYQRNTTNSTFPSFNDYDNLSEELTNLEFNKQSYYSEEKPYVVSEYYTHSNQISLPFGSPSSARTPLFILYHRWKIYTAA